MKANKNGNIGKAAPLIIITVTIFALGWLIFEDETRSNDIKDTVDVSVVKSATEILDQKILIAACPTFFQIIRDEVPEKYRLIQTSSTAQSLRELSLNKVDAAIIGRVLKPEEYGYNCQEIGSYDSYSFLSHRKLSIKTHDLKDMIAYTDLDPADLSQYLDIGRIETVENVYNLVEKDMVVITSWDNTDYSKAEIVHVMNPDNSRFIRSRTPKICCVDECPQDYTNEFTSIIYLKEEDF